jgi:hypothetical protein
MFDWLKSGKAPAPRKGMPSPRLDEREFKRRFRAQFFDQNFDTLTVELHRIADAAWQAYAASRKAPRTSKAGAGFADPDYELALDWIEAADAIKAAERQHADADGAHHVLLINGSSRSEHTCSGEMSKSFRLVEIAREALAAQRANSTCRGSFPNTAVIFIRARDVFRRHPRSVTGRVPAIRITLSGRCKIG